MPGIIHCPGKIPGGQVLYALCASMDIFPTLLRAAGGNPGASEVDGRNILPYLQSGQALPERDIFWEMDKQTAMRRGPWKLVLEGQLVEGRRRKMRFTSPILSRIWGNGRICGRSSRLWPSRCRRPRWRGAQG